MKRIKIFKAYFILWLFVYFITVSNLEMFKEYFLSTLTFNIAIVSILAIGTFMILKGSKDLTMIAGTFGVLMYKKKGLTKHLKGIEKNFPSNIAKKIKSRAESGLLLFTEHDKEEILTWIDEKFGNQNRYNNFFIGTALMIGLLGTFSGLLGAISSMADIVSSLAGNNVNISQIMADFSGPLGSMAVGFGSSLFGVITAIVLSIKGYLLNKAQATLLAGVENWLNEKTLEPTSSEDRSPVMVSTNNLNEHQKSFMDVFIEQISSLNRELKELSHSNDQFKTAFLMTTQHVQKSYDEQMNLLKSMKSSMDNLSNTLVQNSKETTHYFSSLNKTFEHSEKKMDHILNAQFENIQNTQSLTTSVDNFRSKTEKNNQQLYENDKMLMDLIIEQKHKDKNRDIEFFELIEAMGMMDKSIKESIQKFTDIDKKISAKDRDNKDYLEHHLSSVHKNESIQ